MMSCEQSVGDKYKILNTLLLLDLSQGSCTSCCKGCLCFLGSINGWSRFWYPRYFGSLDACTTDNQSVNQSFIHSFIHSQSPFDKFPPQGSVMSNLSCMSAVHTTVCWQSCQQNALPDLPQHNKWCLVLYPCSIHTNSHEYT